MNIRRLAGLSLSVCLSELSLHAQAGDEIETLRKEMQAMKESFEKSQAESRKKVEELTRKLDAVMRAQSNAPPPFTATNQPAPAVTPEQKKLEEQLAAELAGIKNTTNPPALTPALPSTPWSPSQP